MINILIIPKELGMGLLINYLVFFHLSVWLALTFSLSPYPSA